MLQRRRKVEIIFIGFCLVLLSLYPIYKNFYNGKAVLTYERHIALLEGRSEFYNPWQYRMLAPYTIEGLMWIYNHTIDKIYPIEQKFNFKYRETSEPTPETKEFLKLIQTPGAVKYLIVFTFFRLLLNLLVFTLAYLLWRKFIESRWLMFFGLSFVSLAMGNAVIASDLTFNTYFDVIFYLITACIIVYKTDPRWLMLVIVLASLNRETSILIPFLYFISQIDFSQFRLKGFYISSIRFPRLSTWVFTGILYILFLAVFLALRQYYGYRPQQLWKAPAGIEMLKLNLFSSMAVKTYFEMIGVFGVIPFIILYKFRAFPLLLRIWFLGIVPIWFAVHFYSVVAYQTRLFMVPLIMILMPMMLWLIEQSYNEKKQPGYAGSDLRTARTNPLYS